MKLQNDLREFIELLSSHGVDYLIVGGHAVAFHGYPRYTGDIDFLIRPTTDNAARLMSALVEFEFGSVGLTAEIFSKPGQVVQLGQPPNRIDLLTEITGVGHEEAWAGCVEADLDGLSVRVLGLAELLKNKRATERAKDRADVEELVKLSEE